MAEPLPHPDGPMVAAIEDAARRPPSHRGRLLAALAAAMVGGVTAWVRGRIEMSRDIAMFWEAARVLLHGGNPYEVIRPGGPLHFDTGFMYPLPGAIALLPVAPFRLEVAAVAVSAAGAAALAWAVTRDGWGRLPLLLSFPMVWCLWAGQWAPLVTAAALLPGFAWAGACKPTLGAAAFVYRPSWRFFIIGSIAGLLSLAVMPDWPLRWIASTRVRPEGNYHVPLLIPAGVLALLALFRWRRPEARLVAAMACVPQSMLFYDQLALGLVARTVRESVATSLWSYAVALGAYVSAPDTIEPTKAAALAHFSRWIVLGYYLPAAALVLLRRNVAVDDAATDGRVGRDAVLGVAVLAGLYVIAVSGLLW